MFNCTLYNVPIQAKRIAEKKTEKTTTKNETSKAKRR